MPASQKAVEGDCMELSQICHIPISLASISSSTFFSFFTWSCLPILLPSCPFVCTYFSSVPYLAYFVKKKISMRLMLCTNCSSCVISNGLQSLAENTSLSDNQRHHLQLWVLRHTCVPAGKRGCHSSRKGRSNVIENSVCICVTGDMEMRQFSLVWYCGELWSIPWENYNQNRALRQAHM